MTAPSTDDAREALEAARRAELEAVAIWRQIVDRTGGDFAQYLRLKQTARELREEAADHQAAARDRQAAGL